MGIEKPIMVALIVLPFSMLGLWIRFHPFRTSPPMGVDDWYWLLCAEDVKRRHRLPPRLSYFMLEFEEQWYPPLYAGLLALLPMRLLEKRGWKVSQVTDLLHSLFIFLGVFLISNNAALAALAGFSYQVANFPLAYNAQLQPRGLANLLLVLSVAGLWFYHDTGSLALWSGVLVLSVLILFLHKMTTQMWVIYLLGFGLWAGDWMIPLLLPISVICAVIISNGFYIKMIRAHWDIVSFWHENIRYLGSHQYYESPRYQKEGFVSTALHQPGVRSWSRKFENLFWYNCFIAVVPVLVYQALISGPIALCNFPLGQHDLKSFLWWWLVMTYIWSLLTTFVPYFTALGAGFYYLYQSFFPLFALVSLMLREMSATAQIWLFTLWALTLFLSGDRYRAYLVRVTGSETGRFQAELMETLDYLKGLPKDGVFCIPFWLSDITAYRTRKKVFGGGHSYGFRTMLKPFFPLMHADVAQTLREKPLSYLLLQRGYLDSLIDIGLEEGRNIHCIYSMGEYALYEVIK